MPSINAVSGVAILSTLLTLAQASPAVQSTTAQAWDDWNNVKSSTRPVVDTTTTTTKSNKASTTSKTLTLEWDDWRSTSAKPSTSVLCPLAYSVYSNGGIVYTKTITDCGKSTSSTAKPSTTAWTSVPCPLAYSVYSNGGIVYTKTITDCGTSTPTAATWSNWNGYNGNGNGYNNNNNGNGNGNGNKNGYNNNGNVVTSTCGYKSTTLIQSKPYEVSVSCGTTSSCKTDAAKVTSSCSTEWASWSSTATPSVSSTCYYGASCTTFHEEKSPYAPTSSCSQTSWCSTATAVGLPSPSSNSKCSTYTIPGQTSCSAVPITSTITKVITVPADSTTGYNSWTSIYNGNGASQCVPSTQTFTACVGGAIAQSLSSTCLTVPGSCSTYHIEQPPYSAVTTCSSTCTTATVQITGTASCSTSVSTSTCPTGSATGPGGVQASTWASWASPSVTGVKSYTGGASVNAGFIGQAMIVVGAIAGAGAFFL